MLSREGQRLSGLRTLLWLALIIGGGALWFFFAAGDQSPRAWRALLINFLFFTSLAGGLAVWPAIVGCCNGAWHRGIEQCADAGIGFAIPSLVALVVLWVGSPHWSPWFETKFHQGGWLDNSFLFGRNLAALLLFWGVTIRYRSDRRKGRGGKMWGGILIAVYALVFSFLGMDFVMALDPDWYSTLAGGYFFMSGLYIAVAGWAFLSALKRDATSEQRLDLGRLIVAFSLMTTYLMYSHLLPIWYEVLPSEVRFIVPRMNFNPGRLVSMALLAVVYFGPLVLLLTERSKRNRWSLGIISLMVLTGMWVERWWLVTPTFDLSMEFGLVELSMGGAMVGLLGMGMELFARWMPGSNEETDGEHGR